MEQFYKAVYALLFHFERDQIGGAIDTVTFFEIARSLKLDYPQSFTIPDSQCSPESAVVHELKGFLSSCVRDSSESHVLILLHYAGHGKKTNNDKSVFLADDAFPRSFRYDQILNPFFPNFADISLFKVDAITILDACYVGIATRFPAHIKIGQAAEVVAAVQANPFAFLRKDGQISFTLKLATKIAFRRRREDASINFPELVVELQQTTNP